MSLAANARVMLLFMAVSASCMAQEEAPGVGQEAIAWSPFAFAQRSDGIAHTKVSMLTEGARGTSARRGSGMRGSFDGFDAGNPNQGHCDPCAAGGQTTLTGWAVNPTLKGGGLPPVTVAFSIDGKPPTLTVLANTPRPDLVKAHVAPNPDHGFELRLPPAVVASLRTGIHTIVASVGADRLPSPCETFECGDAPPPPPPPPDNDRFEYIENAEVRLGVDMARGGSIGFLSSKTAPDPSHRGASKSQYRTSLPVCQNGAKLWI